VGQRFVVCRVPRLVKAAIIIGLVSGVSACGSSSSSSSSAGATDAASTVGSTGAVAEAKARIAPYLTQPASIGITVPLVRKPPPKHVFFVINNNSGNNYETIGLEQATKALGWKLTTLVFSAGDPVALNGTVQQAVNEHADYIITGSAPASQYAQALKSAQQANIPVVDLFPEDKVVGPGTGLLALVDPLAEQRHSGGILADWVIADSGAHAKVAIFNLPSFQSITQVNDGFDAEMQRLCPQCSVSNQSFSQQAFSTNGVTSQVVTYMQGHPDTQYLVFTNGTFTVGMRQALDAAGVSRKVKIVGVGAFLNNIQALLDHQESAWFSLPVVSLSWQVIDVLARHSLGMSLTPDNTAPVPRVFLTPQNVSAPARLYPGPTGYQAQFEKLWHVSGS
jgi:ribose transport system substrate-binding protein